MELEDLRWVFVFKYVLSSSPSIESQELGSCVVMAIYSEYKRLAFAKPGDEAWICIESPHVGYEDAIYFNGKFYAITMEGVLVICEVDKDSPKTIDFASPPEYDAGDNNKFYLVEMSGNLLLVERIILEIDSDSEHNFHYWTLSLQVFKFDFQTRSWKGLLDIGDNALFIGNNNSFALSTSKHTRFARNSIYFTDDHLETYPNYRFCDMGYYDLTKESDEEEETTDEDETVEEAGDEDETVEEARDEDETVEEARDEDETVEEARDEDETVEEARDEDETVEETRDEDETVEETKEKETRNEDVAMDAEEKTTGEYATKDMENVDPYKFNDTGCTFSRPLFIMPSF
ncbi:hypothetical protein AQUCO_02000348v1 [Aquilegia coerulea]|nr:hypothetical protein AQUCO_02000348v1 [Aquilegia coerulea]